VVPPERRELRDKRLVDRHTSGAHLAERTAEIAAVEQDSTARMPPRRTD
jgi:hypothetical protein